MLLTASDVYWPFTSNQFRQYQQTAIKEEQYNRSGKAEQYDIGSRNNVEGIQK